MDDGLIAPTFTELSRVLLEALEQSEEDADKEWNSPYPPSKSQYHYKIPGIWTYSGTNHPNQDNSSLPNP